MTFAIHREAACLTHIQAESNRVHAMSDAWDDMAAAFWSFDGSYERARDRFSSLHTDEQGRG